MCSGGVPQLVFVPLSRKTIGLRRVRSNMATLDHDVVGQYIQRKSHWLQVQCTTKLAIRVVPKNKLKKWWMIIDSSVPQGSSMNDGISEAWYTSH